MVAQDVVNVDILCVVDVHHKQLIGRTPIVTVTASTGMTIDDYGY